MSTPDGEKEPRGGFVYDSVINQVQSRPRSEEVAKILRFKRGKDVVAVSHTVNNVFSIVKRPQRGAAANLTISMSINIPTRN